MLLNCRSITWGDKSIQRTLFLIKSCEKFSSCKYLLNGCLFHKKRFKSRNNCCVEHAFRRESNLSERYNHYILTETFFLKYNINYQINVQKEKQNWKKEKKSKIWERKNEKGTFFTLFAFFDCNINCSIKKIQQHLSNFFLFKSKIPLKFHCNQLNRF